MLKPPSELFTDVVQLYRGLGCPRVEDDYYQATFVADEAHANLILSLRNQPRGEVGFIENLSIDSQEYGEDDTLPESLVGTTISLEYGLPAGSSRFYPDIQSYVRHSSSLRRGLWGGNVYIVDIDYLPGDAIENGELEKLWCVCSLIRYLDDLSHYSTEQKKGQLLGFMVKGSSDNSFEPFSINTSFDASVFQYPKLELGLLDAIMSASEEVAHVEERKSILRVTLAEVLGGRSSQGRTFNDLVQCWEEVLETYNKNFETYISGFSFNKARQEIADKQADIAKKLSAVLTDQTGKLLSLPVSFVAPIAVLKATSVPESLIYTLGALVLSIVLALILDTQKFHFAQVCRSARLVLDQFNEEGLENSLVIEVREARKQINDQVSRLRLYFVGLRGLIWLPAMITCMIVIHEHYTELSSYLSLFADIADRVIEAWSGMST